MSWKKELQNKWHRAMRFIYSAFLTPLAKEIVKSGGKLVEEAARVAVRTSAISGGTNEEKFNMAWKAVIRVLRTKGIDYTITGVQGAVIAAYAEFKASSI